MVFFAFRWRVCLYKLINWKIIPKFVVNMQWNQCSGFVNYFYMVSDNTMHQTFVIFLVCQIYQAYVTVRVYKDPALFSFFLISIYLKRKYSFSRYMFTHIYVYISIPCWGGASVEDLGRRAPREARLQLARRPLMMGAASSQALFAAPASLNVT
jgi:hypothetical protein